MKEELKLVYFLFQRKGQKGLNQKVAAWQHSFKKETQKKLNILKDVKGPYWDKYKDHLKKTLGSPWFLTHLGKKSNYFIFGSTFSCQLSINLCPYVNIPSLWNVVTAVIFILILYCPSTHMSPGFSCCKFVKCPMTLC